MPVAEVERKILETLDKLGIAYVRHEHPPVATVEEAEKHWSGLKGTHCKNLFLRNSKGNRHYLVIAHQAPRPSPALGFHPNVNTATLEIAFADFEKFLASCGNTVRWLEL